MTKHVVPRETVAHLWAHKVQDNARTPSGNFYFTGPAIYSYGSHFLCGYMMPDEYQRNGQQLVLVNAGTYSMTTGRHMDAMRHALPRYYARVEVAALNNNVVFQLNADGAWRVANSLLDMFRAAVADAATHRNVQANTRGAHLYRAAIALGDLRHILQCDAARKDIPADKRKRARDMLRKLPQQVPGIDQDATRKDARATCEAFASLVMRDKYREDAANAFAGFRRYIGRAGEYANDPAVFVGTYRNARDTLNDLEQAQTHYTGAAHSAKLGGLRVPADVHKLAGTLPALRAKLETMQAQEMRADALNTYADYVQKARFMLADDPGHWLVRDYMIRASAAAGKLATLDSDAEREERAATLATLRDAIENAEKATAPERARDALALAREALQSDRLDNARKCARLAAKLDETHNDDANAIIAAADTRENELHAERIAAWRAGSLLPLPRRMESGALLRLSSDGERIETSQGADVPVSVAPLVWQAANACRESGKSHNFREAGGDIPRLGHFTLDQVTENGDIHAGCHFITYAELQRIAVSLGYIARLDKQETREVQA